MTGPKLARAGRSRPLKRASVVAAVAAVAVAGLGAAPAHSAGNAACPAPTPIGDLAPGQDVTGLTVSQGTTPDGFTGKVLGVVNDGIEPGMDLIMVRLNSTEIDRVGGIWEGMSGSPVYASDGSLIGAVAYGLSVGPSPTAGVTPAADMEALLGSGVNHGTGPMRTHIGLSPTMQHRLVRAHAATPKQAQSGLSELKTPFSLGGLSPNRPHYKKITKAFRRGNLRLVPSGTGTTDPAATDIVPGGNLAASLSYGDITAGGLGTTTAVCGNQVLGFGHPFQFTGPSTMFLHGADALYVQEDPTLTPFKVGNLSVPVGTVTQDRMAGIVGVPGALPAATHVQSMVQVGDRSRSGTTDIAVPDYVPDLAFIHLLVDQDTVLDGYGQSSGTVGWTIQGTRADGSPWTLTRSDLFADPYDVSFASSESLYETLAKIQYNKFEKVSIDSVDTSSTLDRSFATYKVSTVELKRHGAWTKVSRHNTLRLPAGSTAKFRVSLVSQQLDPMTVKLPVAVPKRARGDFGSLEIYGGGSSGGGYFFFSGASGGSAPKASSAKSFDDVLSRLQNAPHNSDVVADLNVFGGKGSSKISKESRTATDHVVTGRKFLSVLVTN
jgi:hypothetical protein